MPGGNPSIVTLFPTFLFLFPLPVEFLPPAASQTNNIDIRYNTALYAKTLVNFIILKGGPRQRNSPPLNTKYIKITIYSPIVKKVGLVRGPYQGSLKARH